MRKELILTMALFWLVLAAVFVGASSLVVNITPTTVAVGNPIYVSVYPPPQGIYELLWIHRSPSFYSGYIDLNCGYKCYGQRNTAYTIPLSYVNGEYYLEVLDYSESEYPSSGKRVYFNVTGGSEAKNLSVNFSPQPAVAGKNISIQIIPGTEGVYKYFYMFSSLDNRIKAWFYMNTEICPAGKFWCYHCFYNPMNVSYFISSSWVNGQYYIWMYDWSEANYSKSWKKFYFNVTNGSERRNMSVNITPKIVQAGKSINVSLTPPTEGTMKYAYIYKNKYGGIYKNYTFFACGNNITWGFCYDSINFSVNIPSWWVSDEYYISFYDYSKNWSDPEIWKKVYFNVIDGAPFRDLSVVMNSTFRIGSNLSAQIFPGSEGISNYVYFYDKNNSYILYENLNQHGCGWSYPCYNPANISLALVSPTWKIGEYKMRITDKNINNYTYFYFNVTNYSCIRNQSEYDACSNDDSKVVIDAPSCAPFTKFINEQCTAYGNFTCGWNNCTLWNGSNCIGEWVTVNNTADTFCWSTPNNKPIGTSMCANGWACPQEQTPYADNASCIASLGIPVQKLGCLSNVTCEFYQSVSQACQDFRIGDCIKSAAQKNICLLILGMPTNDFTCTGYLNETGLVQERCTAS